MSYDQSRLCPSSRSQILIQREDASKQDRAKDDPKFWAGMLLGPMLYGILIPILYQLCKKLGDTRGQKCREARLERVRGLVTQPCGAQTCSRAGTMCCFA